MTRYIALIDGAPGAFGAVFPDLPGCTAMGTTMDEALVNATEALRDFVETARARGEAVPAPRSMERLRQDEPEVREALAHAASLATVALIEDLARPVKANLSLDSGVLAAIDAAAERLRITRSATVEMLARRYIAEIS